MIKRSQLFPVSLTSLLLCLFLSCSISNAPKSKSDYQPQENYFVSVKNANSLHVNPFDQLFFITNNNTLNHYTVTGEKRDVFIDQSAGSIHTITVWDELRYLIYYKDFSKIIVIDRFKAVEREIDLISWNMPDINAATMSRDGNLWLYDQTNRKIEKYTFGGKKILGSTDLTLLTESSLLIDYMIERNNHLFLLNIYGDILVFDNLGRYIRTLPAKAERPLTVLQNKVCYSSGDQYICQNYDGISDQFVVSTLPIGIKEAVLTENQLWMMDEYGVFTKKYTREK